MSIESKIKKYNDKKDNTDNSKKKNVYSKKLKFYLRLQKGGSFLDKSNEILNFIETSTKEKIKEELYDKLKFEQFCPKILGEGFFGKVYLPDIDELKKIDLPIVIKEAKNLDNPYSKFVMDIIDNILYISGNANITTEALILIYLTKLYNKTVHLPQILGYGTCSESKFVDRIITLKHGRKTEYELDLTGKIYNLPFFRQGNETSYKFKSYLSTFAELFAYIHYNKKQDGSVDLPNGINCQVYKLFDYFSITYLATYHLLTENGIFPYDLHISNLFIHWLNDKSFYKGKSIENVKKIVYKIKDKYYEIETFGLLLILGDLGMCTIKIRDDVILIGQMSDMQKNYKTVDILTNPNINADKFMLWNNSVLTFEEYMKTIAYKIRQTEPYVSYPSSYHLVGDDVEYLNKLKSSSELLDYFDEKYGKSSFVDNEDTILIRSVAALPHQPKG